MNYFDLHCDTLSEMLKNSSPLSDGETAVTLQKGEGFKSWCQCFAIWTHDSIKGDAAYQNYKKQLDLLKEQALLNSDRMVFCKTRADMEQAVAEDKCAAILTVENGAVIAGDLTRINELKKDGVKIFSFTWNGKNELGSGVGGNHSLSMIGRSAVVELNRANITIDVSHISDKGFYDILNLTSKPIIATHSNSRRICKHPRNLTDEQFEAIVHTDGIVGINFYKQFLNNSKNAGFVEILRHIDHFLSLGGENSICIGSDFDGAETPAKLKDVSMVGSLREELLRHGYKEELAEKILFKNAYEFAVKNFD